MPSARNLAFFLLTTLPAVSVLVGAFALLPHINQDPAPRGAVIVVICIIALGVALLWYVVRWDIRRNPGLDADGRRFWRLVVLYVPLLGLPIYGFTQRLHTEHGPRRTAPPVAQS
jgi:hypothetical protein